MIRKVFLTSLVLAAGSECAVEVGGAVGLREGGGVLRFLSHFISHFVDREGVKKMFRNYS